ncbi:MAG: DNA starvation/stationary phase protection protein [Bacteroidia bacterium]|nr:DNA starvation/stationary phase protection protein [Bacteroidia bacterium]
MKTNIGITEKNTKQSVTILEVLLANEMLLYVKTRKAHWNITGESFMELHKLFQLQYTELEASVDEIAERIGKLGHKTIGTMSEFLKLATLKEHSAKDYSTKEVLKELLKDHETVVVELRESLELYAEKNNDLGTVDFLTGLIQQHETTAWILRRYLN